MATLKYLYAQFKYKNEDALSNVVSYVMNPHGDMRLLENGSMDLFLDTPTLYAQLFGIQNAFRSDANIGKRAIHAVIEFTREELAVLAPNRAKLLLFCNMFSQYYHSIGHQNLYGIFRRTDGRLQVDFVLNSVNWISGKKMVCTKNLTEEHQQFVNYYLGHCMEEEENRTGDGRWIITAR